MGFFANSQRGNIGGLKNEFWEEQISMLRLTALIFIVNHLRASWKMLDLFATLKNNLVIFPHRVRSRLHHYQSSYCQEILIQWHCPRRTKSKVACHHQTIAAKWCKAASSNALLPCVETNSSRQGCRRASLTSNDAPLSLAAKYITIHIAVSANIVA